MTTTTAVRARPILFSGPMVRAILDGSKTQTRRVVTQRTALEWLAPGMFAPSFVADSANGLSPYGFAGDRLWVRETWGWQVRGGGPLDDEPESRDLVYRADHPTLSLDRWRPSIHMPRAASRITLEVTGVRVERMQEISEADARAEGLDHVLSGEYPDGALDRPGVVANYWRLWDSLNEARGYGWDANPWVWVVEFRQVSA